MLTYGDHFAHRFSLAGEAVLHVVASALVENFDLSEIFWNVFIECFDNVKNNCLDYHLLAPPVDLFAVDGKDKTAVAEH